MPDREINKIMMATEPADVAQMALIECVRQMADNGKQTNDILRGMQTELRDVRERVIRIEAMEFKTEISATKAEIDRLRKEELAKLDARVDALEDRDNQRIGATGMADAILKYGPFAIALITALFIVLIATKRIAL